MALSAVLYLWFLAAVALGRLIELRYSRSNQKRLEQAGSRISAEPGYRWMVMFHAGVLIGSALEVVLLARPFLPWLAAASFAAWLTANGLRWWAIRTLGPRWNVNVMQISPMGIAVSGPYRWVRHPNYTAVYLEMLALPLIHSAWIVAACGAVLHVIVLARRVRLEESVLMKDSAYRTAFAAKPRFIPSPGVLLLVKASAGGEEFVGPDGIRRADWQSAHGRLQDKCSGAIVNRAAGYQPAPQAPSEKPATGRTPSPHE